MQIFKKCFIVYSFFWYIELRLDKSKGLFGDVRLFMQYRKKFSLLEDFNPVDFLSGRGINIL